MRVFKQRNSAGATSKSQSTYVCAVVKLTSEIVIRAFRFCKDVNKYVCRYVCIRKISARSFQVFVNATLFSECIAFVTEFLLENIAVLTLAAQSTRKQNMQRNANKLC